MAESFGIATPTTICSDFSTPPVSPMGTPLRKVFERISGLAYPWRRGRAPQGRHRVFRRDVQQDDFQYASARCLSSYYSVFVARLAIMVMLAILIGLLTILTWHITKTYTTKSLNSLAYGLRHELLQRPILRMWNILNSTVEITTAQVKLSEYVIRRYSKPDTQAEQVQLYEAMRDVTWALFVSRKALNAITINYRNGFVQAFHRDHRSSNTFYIYSDLMNYSISTSRPSNLNMLSSLHGWNDQTIHGNTSATWYRVSLDPVTGERIGKPRTILPDDLINIAGLSQVPDGVASWHVAVSKYSDSPLLSAALPVWDPSNESIVAVVGVTTALYSVGQLMKELVEFHSGHIYLTSQEGYLLATSSNTPLLINSTKGPKLMMANHSQDQVIQLGAEWLQRTYGNSFPANHEVHVENAELDRQHYYIDSFFLNLKRLPMVGVIIIPRKYILGKVDERAFKTLVILISASLCTLVIGCLCIFLLTNGVSKEMKLRAELISHLDARRRAEASSNYKSQFLANMSHELRTPMAAVIGLLDILVCDDCLTNEQYSTVTQIRKCSTALLRLLNNILDLSKVESGKLVLEEAEFNLARELEGLVDMFSVQCINHNVETILDLSDDMPKLVRGDSARVVQIFANLISNSLKFTPSGHIIIRGWCGNSRTMSDFVKLPLEHKISISSLKTKLKQHGSHARRASKKDNKVTLWFEVDDTGCGIDPSKWESVFESFEQADPSTTRLHGGTGLGLCIVRTLVNKMGGEIKVIKKNGPGTLMRLYLLLNAPVDGTEHNCSVDYAVHNIRVLLAQHGSTGRFIMSGWLRRNGVSTLEASGWNELTQILQELYQGRNSGAPYRTVNTEHAHELPRSEVTTFDDIQSEILIIVVDIELLDLNTDIWKEQLNFLDKYHRKAKFAWMLNHDTFNAVKVELRRKGHMLMVNKPLYKAKMIQILDAAIKERNSELLKRGSNSSKSMNKEEDLHECLEIDSEHYEGASSDELDTVETSRSGCTNTSPGEQKQQEGIKTPPALQHRTSNYHSFNSTLLSSDYNNLGNEEEACPTSPPLDCPDNAEGRFKCTRSVFSSKEKEDGNSEAQEQLLISKRPPAKVDPCSSKELDQKGSLEGLCILLAEDTPVLQRVATIMLEKLGAKVIAVGDGLQAVNALNSSLDVDAEDFRTTLHLQNANRMPQAGARSWQPYDLILMDCQMPQMDGYEATKAIRRSEAGSGLHIPIVALTAHAMSSDEAKCLEVGMDAYLTKPIDYKLMVSTILSLTKGVN